MNHCVTYTSCTDDPELTQMISLSPRVTWSWSCYLLALNPSVRQRSVVIAMDEYVIYLAIYFPSFACVAAWVRPEDGVAMSFEAIDEVRCQLPPAVEHHRGHKPTTGFGFMTGVLS